MTVGDTTANYTILDEGRAIQCLACNQVSHNSGDVTQRYCANCKAFHDAPVPIPADVRAMADAMLFDAHAVIAQGGTVIPTLMVMRRADRASWHPRMNMGDAAAREEMAQETRLLADQHDADLVVLMSEAWQHPACSLEKMAALRERYDEIANMPDRQEILLLTIETPQNYWQGKAPISRQGASRRCGELVYDGDYDYALRGGRFRHLLDTPTERAERAATLALIGQHLVDQGLNPSKMIPYDDAEYPLLEVFRREMVKGQVTTIEAGQMALVVSMLRNML